MNEQKLVKMVNEIAAFFDADSDRAAALESVANHLTRFWDPRMRSAILRWVDEHDGEGLKETALAAIRTHREKLVPASGSRG